MVMWELAFVVGGVVCLHLEDEEIFARVICLWKLGEIFSSSTLRTPPRGKPRVV